MASLSIVGFNLHIVGLILLQLSQINSAPYVGVGIGKSMVDRSGIVIFGDVFIMVQTGEGFALHVCACCCSLRGNWEDQWKHLSHGFYPAGKYVSIS